MSEVTKNSTTQRKRFIGISKISFAMVFLLVSCTLIGFFVALTTLNPSNPEFVAKSLDEGFVRPLALGMMSSAAVIVFVILFKNAIKVLEPLGLTVTVTQGEAGGGKPQRVAELSHQLAKAVQNVLTRLSERVDEIEKNAREVTRKIESIEVKDVEEIASSIKAKLLEESAGQIKEELATSVAKAYKDEQAGVDISGIFNESTQRLSVEISGLIRRGSVNLAIGIATSGVGLLVLGFLLVFGSNSDVSLTAFLIHYLPRLTLVIMFEVLAYFFLGLYRSSLQEIKFFQNEITNIESKHLALRAAIHVGNSEVIGKALLVIVDTDRNPSWAPSSGKSRRPGKDELSAAVELVRLAAGMSGKG